MRSAGSRDSRVTGSERWPTRGRAAGGERDRREEIVLRVGAPAHGGRCVARPVDGAGGRVVFVRHALPGETVRAVLTDRSARAWRAETIEVLSASPDRVRSVWPEAGSGGVGGGELGHVALPAQRTWKQWVLADCLRRIGGQEVAAAVAALPEAAATGTVPVEAMPSERAAEASGDSRTRRRAGTGARTRVALTVTDDGRAGMHCFRSGRVLPVTHLPLAVSEIRALGLTERAVWHRRYSPGARVRAVAPGVGEPVVIISNGSRDRILTASGHTTGRRRVTEVVNAAGLGLGELRYSLHAEGFWQVHRDAPAVLVDRVVRAVISAGPTAAGTRVGDGPADRDALAGVRVVELYAGAGLLTAPLAALGARVRSLEGSEQAVRDARRTLHDRAGVDLLAGEVTPASVEELGRFDPDGVPGADVVILDPPRRGAGRAVVEAVAALGAGRVVMVSCDPAAGARDLGIFMGFGYRPVAVSALDMFPHTHHVEVVCVLERD